MGNKVKTKGNNENNGKQRKTKETIKYKETNK